LGRPAFTKQVLKALELVNGYTRADTDRNGLTFDELERYIRDVVADSTDDYDGYLMVDPAGDDLVPQQLEFSLYSYKSDDFEATIPEPACLSLLAFGALGMLRWKR